MKKIALVALVLVSIVSPALARPHLVYQNSTATMAPWHISCEMVRNYVNQVGLVRAEAMALAAGMTRSQEQEARRCLTKPI